MRAQGATERVRVRMSTEDRWRQILHEGTRIVGQRGYYGFSVQDVAEACGLTVAGLLHHVGSKAGLLVALLEERDRNDKQFALGAGPEVAVAGGSDLDASVAAMRRLVVHNSMQPELVRLYSVLRGEALSAGHPAYEYFRERDAWALSQFAGMVDGAVPSPGATARQLLALMGGLEEQWLRDPDGVDLVAEWDRAVAAVLPLGGERARSGAGPGPQTVR